MHYFGMFLLLAGGVQAAGDVGGFAALACGFVVMLLMFPLLILLMMPATIAGMRTELDQSSEKLGKKIRAGKTAKIPYLVVLGGREMENATITVEGYFDGKLPDLSSVDSLVARMGNEITKKVWRRKL